MTRIEILHKVIQIGAVAVIRADDPTKLLRIVEAIHKGGVSAIEITMTVPRALDLIEQTAKELGDEVILGVGSVLDPETTRMALNAGARYVVSPIYKASIIQMAHRYDAPAMPGCFSPTEILEAYENGADLVKVFPANILGMKYFKAIKAPMPHLQLMPTGGVSLTNAGEWMAHGASAVGIGSALLDKKAIAEERYDQLTENARTLMRSIQEYRQSS